MSHEVLLQVHNFQGPGVAGDPYPREETYTLSGGPGQTPVAAYIVYSSSALTLDARSATARISVGMTDGTRQRSICIIGEDGAAAASAFAGGRIDTGSVIQVTTVNGSGFSREATFAAFGTDSITLEWSSNDNGFGYIVFIFAPAAAVGHSTSSASIGGTASVTGLGFQPDAVLGVTAGETFVANGAFVDFSLSYGFAGRLPSVTQACSVLAAEQQADPTAATAIARDDVFASRITHAAGVATEETRLEMTSFNSDGFTYTTRNAAVAIDHMYLALDLGDRAVFCDAPLVDTSATGNEAIPGAGFTPQFVTVAANVLAAVNTLNTGVANSLAIGVYDGTTQGGCGVMVRDNQATSDTFSTASQTNVLHTILTSASSDFVASVASFDDDGFTINVSDASGAARPIAYMAIENREEIVTTETVGVSDEYAFRLDQVLSLSETVGISDEVVLFIQTVVTTETVGIADEIVLVSGTAGDLTIVVAETVGITDRPWFDGEGTIVVAETVGIADEVAPFLGNVIVVTDEVVGITDEYATSGLLPSKGNARGTTLDARAEAGTVLAPYAERGTVL